MKLRESLKVLNSGWTFREQLNWLGHHYDEVTDPQDKKATLTQMMSLFTIPREHIYMDLIASGTQSVEMKRALYQALAKLFKTDPSWRPFLDRAAQTAGI